jgi:signal transduction histidine kinase
MFPLTRQPRLIAALALAGLVFALFSLRHAVRWYAHPFGGILLDPDGQVSSFGLPAWDGFRQGLQYPDQILEVDGRPLVVPPGGSSRAETWDRAVEAAARAGHPTVHVRAHTSGGDRELDLRIDRLDPIAFWMIGGLPIAIALLYGTGAVVALLASPKGRLARTFAKTTLLAALFLLTLFDYHTTRRLVPLFYVAFAMVPMGFFALPLRLPDEVPWLSRRPWIVSVLDGSGAAIALAMIAAHLLGATTVALRALCTALFGASFFFFAAAFLIRFARAKGDRRATMRALLVAMVPAHVVIGSAFVLGSFSLGGATSALLAVPALALTPLSSVVALVRHDLWGSRALLSRGLSRGLIVLGTSALSIVLGTAVAAVFHVAPAGALLAATVAGLAAGLLVQPALHFGDQALFPSRAVYKPTIEQLSEELTLITVPEEVGHAVERTVRRWLPCEHVEFCPVRPITMGETPQPPRSGLISKPPVPPEDEHGAASGIHPLLNVSQLATTPDKAAPSSVPPPPVPTADPATELRVDVLFRGSPLAVIEVGRKRGGALFTSEDMDLLRTIANQAALALAHAYSYAELELRRRQQAAAWRGEREALVETVAAEIAHEVRYPINYFRSLFRRGQGSLRLDAEDVDIGCDEVERLERLVSGLRRVVTRRLERRRVTVDDLVVKSERLLRDHLGTRTLEVDVRAGEERAALRCDYDQVTQVLVNLISNALDAAGDTGRVGVSWASSPQGGGVLTVWDTGDGFEGDPSRVFAPWYTTKPRGTGLGLAITHRIVRAHGWTIEPERRGDRTLFVIEIPASDIARSSVHDGGSAPNPPGERGMEVA